MKRRIIALFLAMTLAIGVSACGAKKEAPKVEVSEEKEEDISQVPESLVEPQTPEEHEPVAEPGEVTFATFAGNYSFMSGAGAWSTDVTIYDDGAFEGSFHDSDMGDVGDGYENGTVYYCNFSGKFTELVKKDEFTYTCSLESITQEGTPNTEEISKEDGIKYICSEPYGFDNAKDFEFYLPGKSVGELNNDFTTWLSIRFSQPYPDTLPCKAFNNLAENEGFEEFSGYMEDINVEYPESLPVEDYQLAGSYHNESLNVTMNISIFSDVIDVDGEIGNITWDIPEDSYIWNSDARITKSGNEFTILPDYGEYKMVVTDNTDGHIVLHLYNSNGFDCGEYVMTTHFES